jgi:myo-inositol 2-dehydrogenase/D-chiro-inositol 1-dehydrogenase
MGQIRAAAFFGSRTSALAGIVESDPQRAKELGQQYHTPVFADVPSAVKNVPGLRGVWIATPTPSHPETIKQVVDAGLAVGIEKPVAESAKEIAQCYKYAAEKGVPLYVSFQRRIDPSYHRLLTAVRAGQIGEVRSIHAVFRDHPVPPIEFLKLGGDIFYDLVVHDADYIMHLLQETPTKIYATGSSSDPELRAINVMDNAHCLMEFGKSGVVANIELSRASPYGYDQRIEVFGSTGMLQLTNLPTTQVVLSSVNGISHDNPVHSFPQRFAQAYLLEVDEFTQVMQGVKPPSVTMEDSLNSVRVAEACRLSVPKALPVAWEEVL